MKAYQILLLFTLLVASVAAIPNAPIDFKPSDGIEVWFFQRVDKPDYNQTDHTFEHLNYMTNRIGFYDRVNNKSFTIEYDIASDDVVDSIFPTVDGDKLIWNNKAIFKYTNNFGSDWDKSGYIMEINGTILAKYLCWLPGYLSSNPYYTLWQVMSAPVNGQLHMPSSNSADFVWNSLQALYNLGGTYYLNPQMGPPSRNFFTLYSSQFHQCKQDEWSKVVAFYNVFKWDIAAETIEFLVANASAQFNGSFYYFYQDLWFALNLTQPLVAVDYISVPLGQSPRDPSSIVVDEKCWKEEEKKHHGGLSGGAIFVIIFIVVVAAYLIVGVTYNIVARKKKGVHVIPNITFWAGLGHMFMDGVRFTRAKLCGGGAGRSDHGHGRDRDFGISSSERTPLHYQNL